MPRPFAAENAPRINCVFIIPESSSIKSGTKRNMIPMVSTKYRTGIFISASGVRKAEMPSMICRSSVEKMKVPSVMIIAGALMSILKTMPTLYALMFMNFQLKKKSGGMEAALKKHRAVL